MRACVYYATVFDFMSARMFFIMGAGGRRFCVYARKCMRKFVGVLCASIMYLDNATASLYQEQLTGIPMHTARQGTRGEE